MSIFHQILYYTGGLVWLIIAIAGSFMLIAFIYKHVLKSFWHSLQNLKMFLFGMELPEGLTYLELWQNKFAHRSGVREHWKSWDCLRRLAYIRLLKEARKELHKKIN